MLRADCLSLATTSWLEKQSSTDTARPWVAVDREDRISYAYSRLAPCTSLVGEGHPVGIFIEFGEMGLDIY